MSAHTLCWWLHTRLETLTNNIRICCQCFWQGLCEVPRTSTLNLCEYFAFNNLRCEAGVHALPPFAARVWTGITGTIQRDGNTTTYKIIQFKVKKFVIKVFLWIIYSPIFDILTSIIFWLIYPINKMYVVFLYHSNKKKKRTKKPQQQQHLKCSQVWSAAWQVT